MPTTMILPLATLLVMVIELIFGIKLPEGTPDAIASNLNTLVGVIGFFGALYGIVKNHFAHPDGK